MPKYNTIILTPSTYWTDESEPLALEFEVEAQNPTEAALTGRLHAYSELFDSMFKDRFSFDSFKAVGMYEIKPDADFSPNKFTVLVSIPSMFWSDEENPHLMQYHVEGKTPGDAMIAAEIEAYDELFNEDLKHKMPEEEFRSIVVLTGHQTCCLPGTSPNKDYSVKIKLPEGVLIEGKDHWESIVTSGSSDEAKLYAKIAAAAELNIQAEDIPEIIECSQIQIAKEKSSYQYTPGM
jgi:hypothetical protein